MSLGQCFDFNAVFQKESESDNERRQAGDPLRPKVTLTSEQEDSSGAAVLFPQSDANLTGLALSGGGVRSAAFCLGALQALHQCGVLKRVDYLSTVSGGGYIGC